MMAAFFSPFPTEKRSQANGQGRRAALNQSKFSQLALQKNELLLLASNKLKLNDNNPNKKII